MTATIPKIPTGTYFTWNSHLFYVMDGDADGYVMIEDCKTYEEAFIRPDDFARMEVGIIKC